MTPGEIELKVVRDRLGILAECVEGLRGLPTGSLAEFRSDPRNAAAADSYLRRAIEALFDTARHLLSRGFGLGALEYREVARAAQEKELVRGAAHAEHFLQIAGYRNRLTHFYDRVTPDELYAIVTERLVDLEAMAEEMRVAAANLAGGRD